MAKKTKALAPTIKESLFVLLANASVSDGSFTITNDSVSKLAKKSYKSLGLESAPERSYTHNYLMRLVRANAGKLFKHTRDAGTYVATAKLKKSFAV
jgi:hypothetical protein